MKPLFPTLNTPSIKPSVLGLVCSADHEISTHDGVIYVQLHPTDDEVYATINFNYHIEDWLNHFRFINHCQFLELAIVGKFKFSLIKRCFYGKANRQSFCSLVKNQCE